MKELERHYRFHLRRMALGLAFSLAMAVAMIFSLVRPGIHVGLLMIPALVFIIASVGLNIALRGWGGPSPIHDDRQVARDEWVQANINRSRRIALQSIYAAQVPLMFFVAYVPSMPTVSTSVVGMAILTMASGSTAFFASYLLHSRLHSDG
jgi:predicted anti-sigma-YlaC factor YlaD